MKINKTLKNDLLLIVPIVLIASVFFIVSRTNNTAGSTVVVEVQGQECARYSLQKDGEYVLNNGTNVLTISDGYAMISDANCADKTCVRQGKISLAGQTIVCLPNMLTVKIIQKQGGVDLVL